MSTELKALVEGCYDAQKLRIQVGNRLVRNIKSRLGQDSGESDDVFDDDIRELLDVLREAYGRLTDGLLVADIKPDKFVGEGVISTYAELMLVHQYIGLEHSETEQFKIIERAVQETPLWKEFLVNVPGCGPAMTAVIISCLDVHKAPYPSSFWRYCGLDVGPDGRGRGRCKEHQIDILFKNKHGEEDTKRSITYNPWIRSKLIGVLGPCFLRAGRNKDGNYAEVYYQYKLRRENAKKGLTKIHIHNQSMRYMIKIFLLHLHVIWSELEGLEPTRPYSEGKLGMAPHGAEPKRVRRPVQTSEPLSKRVKGKKQPGR